MARRRIVTIVPRGLLRQTATSSRGFRRRARPETIGAAMAGRIADPALTKIGTTAI
jgi:hypothetical protein